MARVYPPFTHPHSLHTPTAHAPYSSYTLTVHTWCQHNYHPPIAHLNPHDSHKPTVHTHTELTLPQVKLTHSPLTAPSQTWGHRHARTQVCPPVQRSPWSWSLLRIRGQRAMKLGLVGGCEKQAPGPYSAVTSHFRELFLCWGLSLTSFTPCDTL